MAEKRGGGPTDFADARGGPSTQQGVLYQREVTLYETLSLLAKARHDPVTAALLRVEPRLLANVEGAPVAEDARANAEGGDSTAPIVKQFGFDLGWDVRPGEPKVRAEVKGTPSASDVRHFVELLPNLLQHNFSDQSALLFAGSMTAPVETLKFMAERAGESATDAEFRAFLTAKPHRSQEDLLELLGDDPRAALRLARVETGLSPVVVSDAIDRMLAELAEPGKSAQLKTAVLDVLDRAAPARRAILLGDLATSLMRGGLLRAAPAPDTSSVPHELACALMVLRICFLPVPGAVLAAVAGIPEAGIADVLAEQVEVGRISVHNGDYFSVSPVELPPPPGFASRIGDGLVALTSLVEREGVCRKEQSANAVAMAEACGSARPDVVARLFKVFDKPAKAFGDLSVILGLASMSDEAARQLAADGEGPVNEWLDLRAHSNICGTGWVYQRVGELERAATCMSRAEQFSETTADADNVAFAAKCTGRLHRMRAEETPDREESHRLLLLSKAKLTEAFQLFAARMSERSGLDEDYGECQSLLARTLFTLGDRAGAAEAVTLAHTLLDHLPRTKAFADLVVLDAEMAVRQHEAAPTPQSADALREHDANLERLLAEHVTETTPTRSRVTSEVSARILLVRSLISAALGDTKAAVRLAETAADLYRQLGYDRAAEQAMWDAFALQPERIPAGLLAALDRLDAVPGARLRAIEQHERLQRDAPLAPAILQDDTNPRWAGIAQEAVRRHVAAATQWGGHEHSASA